MIILPGDWIFSGVNVYNIAGVWGFNLGALGSIKIQVWLDI